MVFEHIEQLKQQYTDQYVTIGHVVPELQRFEGRTGIVRTVNMSGRALVEFLGTTDISWYDIDVDYLKIVDKPPEPVAETKPRKQVVANDESSTKLPPGKGRPAATGPSTADILAQARAKKPEKAATAKPAKPAPKKPNTADILAMARAKKADSHPDNNVSKDTPKPAETKALSTAEKLALLRGEKSGEAKPSPETISKKKPHTADILAMARGDKKPPEKKPPADKDPPAEAKPSTADILAMARAAKKKSSEDAMNKPDNPSPDGADS